MDERVREFVNGVVDGAALNPAEVRDRVWQLFIDVDDERSRVALLSTYDAAMRITVDHMNAEGEEVDGFLGAIATDKCAFVILESMVDDVFVDADEFDRIVDREVGAGRMHGREFIYHAKEAAKVVREQREAWWMQEGAGGATVH